MKKAFFFDRDGAINNSIYRFENEYNKNMDCAPIKVEDLKLIEGIKDTLDKIKEKGFIPIIITNQPDFLKKDLLLKEYERITTKICSELGIERSQIFECFHKEGFSSKCKCRKPEPGLFFMAKGMYDIDLENSWMIGDSWKDIAAADKAGIKNTIFLKRPKIENQQEGNEESIVKMSEMDLKPKHLIEDIKEIVNFIK